MAPRCARRPPRLAGCEAGLQPNDNRDRKQNHARTINPTHTLLLPAFTPIYSWRARRASVESGAVRPRKPSFAGSEPDQYRHHGSNRGLLRTETIRSSSAVDSSRF